MRGERGAALRWESSPKARSAAGSSRPDSGAGGSNLVFVVEHASPPCVSCRRWRTHFARFKRAEVAIVGKSPPAGQVILRGVFWLGFGEGIRLIGQMAQRHQLQDLRLGRGRLRDDN